MPQANRALRNFNMHLNMRQPPLRSKLPFNPFAFLFARPPEPTTPASPTHNSPVRRRSPSPSGTGGRRNSSVPLAPIPPASNPRGELIFSSRVDRAFRESYDRYRGQFERRREERERAAYAQTWTGWAHLKMPWMRVPPPPPPAAGGQPAQGQGQQGREGSTTPVGSLRGMPKGRTGSPAGSRRSSPHPGRTGRKVSGTPPAREGQHPLAVGPVKSEEDA